MQLQRSRLSARAALPLTAGLFSILGLSCVAPPPTISALSGRSLAVKVFVFGADAEDAKTAFEAIHSNNPGFTVVQNGGDADVLLGVEKDSAKCVEPTALCSYRISYRVRNPKGELLKEDSATILQDADSCARLCKKVLNKVAVTVVEAAAAAVQSGAPAPASSASAEAEPEPAPVASASASSAPSAAPSASVPPWKRPPGGAPSAKPPEPPKPEPPKPEPPKAKGKEPKICSVGNGPKLPPEEAEKRVAQVDALKRLGVLTQEEFDCLKTAYLARL